MRPDTNTEHEKIINDLLVSFQVYATEEDKAQIIKSLESEFKHNRASIALDVNHLEIVFGFLAKYYIDPNSYHIARDPSLGRNGLLDIAGALEAKESFFHERNPITFFHLIGQHIMFAMIRRNGDNTEVYLLDSYEIGEEERQQIFKN